MYSVRKVIVHTIILPCKLDSRFFSNGLHIPQIYNNTMLNPIYPDLCHFDIYIRGILTDSSFKILKTLSSVLV